LIIHDLFGFFIHDLQSPKLLSEPKQIHPKITYVKKDQASATFLL